MEQHPILIPVGLAVAKARKARGFSQKALAWRCNMDKSYISRVENGEINLTVGLLSRIAVVLGVPVAMFFQDCTDGRGGTAAIANI